MSSKLLCVVLLCIVFTEMSSVFGHPTTEATVYTETIIVEDKSYYIPPTTKMGTAHGYQISENSSCKDKAITLSDAQSPGILSVRVLKNHPVKCAWIIEAPEGKRVYIHSFNYDIESNVEISSDQKKSLYDDALNVSIYDGDHVDESKRLFKIGDEKLENVKSTGRRITFSLDFKNSDKYLAQMSSLVFVYV